MRSPLTKSCKYRQFSPGAMENDWQTMAPGRLARGEEHWHLLEDRRRSFWVR